MQQRRRWRAFTDSFKAEVVELCRKGDQSVAEVARELDLTETAVRQWVQHTEIDAGQRPGLTSSEHEELVRLSQEVRVLREERDNLKRATARGGPGSRSRPGPRRGAKPGPLLAAPALDPVLGLEDAAQDDVGAAQQLPPRGAPGPARRSCCRASPPAP